MGLLPELKVGLALGGGGAKGMAHLGVLQALEKGGIPIHMVAGTSVGAAVGAAYCLDPNAERVSDKLRDFLNSDSYKVARMDFVIPVKKSAAAWRPSFIWSPAR